MGESGERAGGAGSGFSGELGACLTKSKKWWYRILFQLGRLGARGWTLFFLWRTGIGMNGLREVGFDKYRGPARSLFFYFFQLSLLKLGFC